MASCASSDDPSGAFHSVAVYGHTIMPAQLISTSIFSISADVLISYAAFCTEEGFWRSITTKMTLTDGFKVLISCTTGSMRDWDRPGRMMMAGLAWRASALAVSEPIEPVLAPVMRTGQFRQLFSQHIVRKTEFSTDRFAH